MLISYSLMLVVMLFDVGIIVAACVGLGCGHYAACKWKKATSICGETELLLAQYGATINNATPNGIVKEESVRRTRARLEGAEAEMQSTRHATCHEDEDTTPCCRT